jgi:predicted Ser/Thr protein kinase
MMNTSQGSSDHDVIGTYRILRLLGRGGMGDVYLAWSGLRLVAVKILNAQHAGDHEFVQMFLAEARVAARINHSGIAQVLDVGMDAGRLYMVMEYVAGNTLDELLRDPEIPGLLPLRVTASMFAFVAHSLGAAHRGRVVHRDISPHNLLISDTGAIKLIDFGIARVQNSDVRTSPGTFRGRFGYMAPEYIQSLPCDHRVDLFALGVVMWETFARQRLYVGTAAAQMFAMIERAAERLDEMIPGFPIELADVVAKLLQRDPELRYLYAEDVASDLDALAPKLPDDGFRNLEHWVTHHLSARIEARALTDREQLQRIAGVEAVNRLTMNLRRPANQFSLPSPAGELAAGTLDTELDGEVTAIEGPAPRGKDRDKSAVPERIAEAERSVRLMRMMSTEKIQRIELEELDDEPSGHGQRSVEAEALPASIVDAVSGATYILSVPGAAGASRAASPGGWVQMLGEQRRGLAVVAALSAVVVVLSLMLGFRGEMRARKGEWRARQAQQEAALLAAKEREAEAALRRRGEHRAAAGTAGTMEGTMVGTMERTTGDDGRDATSGAGRVVPAEGEPAGDPRPGPPADPTALPRSTTTPPRTAATPAATTAPDPRLRSPRPRGCPTA